MGAVGPGGPTPAPVGAPPTPAGPPAPQVTGAPLFGASHGSDTGLGQLTPYQTGLATYYADSLAGNHTASGEIYRPGELSAAHRTLPFGTVVDVVRDDGRWVRVRVNDRGPFTKGRIVDLSRRAAELVGLIGPGVAPVRLYVVGQSGR